MRGEKREKRRREGWSGQGNVMGGEEDLREEGKVKKGEMERQRWRGEYFWMLERMEEIRYKGSENNKVIITHSNKIKKNKMKSNQTK